MPKFDPTLKLSKGSHKFDCSTDHRTNFICRIMPMDLAYNIKAVDRATGQEYASIHVPARSAEAIVYITVAILMYFMIFIGILLMTFGRGSKRKRRQKLMERKRTVFTDSASVDSKAKVSKEGPNVDDENDEKEFVGMFENSKGNDLSFQGLNLETTSNSFKLDQESNLCLQDNKVQVFRNGSGRQVASEGEDEQIDIEEGKEMDVEDDEDEIVFINEERFFKRGRGMHSLSFPSFPPSHQHYKDALHHIDRPNVPVMLQEVQVIKSGGRMRERNYKSEIVNRPKEREVLIEKIKRNHKSCLDSV